MALTYDREGFKKIAEQMKKLSGAKEKIAANVSSRFGKLLERQFSEGVDPSGEPWKPLESATLKKHNPPAFSGSAMRQEAEVQVIAGRVAMTIPSPAEFHQGNRHLLPSNTGDSGDLPEPYEAALRAAVDDVLKQK